MNIRFVPIPSVRARDYWQGQSDENSQHPETVISDGTGNPCRHCLTEIPAGKKMLILAYRPEQKINPYAEVGPVFLCAEPCERHPVTGSLPSMFLSYESLLVRGYNSEGRIVYGTGGVVGVGQIEERACSLFEDNSVEYVHLRSASNNCYQCKVERWSG